MNDNNKTENIAEKNNMGSAECSAENGTTNKTVYRSGGVEIKEKRRPVKKNFNIKNFFKKNGTIKAGIAGLLAVAIIAGVALSIFGGKLWGTPNTGSNSFGDGEQYNFESYQIDVEKYQGTVLEESEDAGMEYAEDTLFLGDSNTNRMLYYYDLTGVTIANGFGVDSMGISTFSTQNCATFKDYGQATMPEVVKLLQPERVVITFGSNNVGMNTDSFIEQYKKAISAVRKAYSYADIIVASIFPVDEYRQNTALSMKSIDQMNQALVEMAKEEDIKFLNWSEAIRDKNTGYSLFESTVQDGVHLTRDGMNRIFTYFRTHSFIMEDDRPQPLKAIPQRIATQPSLIKQDPNKKAGPYDWSKVEPSSASSSSSSSSEAAAIKVEYTVWDSSTNSSGGGTLSVGGESGKYFSFTTSLGATTSAVTAVADTGYQFVGWSCTVGSIGDVNNPSLPGFTVPSNAETGKTITVTALFQKVEASSSSSEPTASEPPVLPEPPVSSEQSIPPEPTPQPEAPPEG